MVFDILRNARRLPSMKDPNVVCWGHSINAIEYQYTCEVGLSTWPEGIGHLYWLWSWRDGPPDESGGQVMPNKGLKMPVILV